MTYVADSVILTVEDLREIWPILVAEDRIAGFSALSRSDAEEFFLSLSAQDQATLVLGLPARERRLWMRLLAPDDAADLLQQVDPEDRDALAGLLDAPTRAEVKALLAYAEDAAGGLMSPRFARLRPEMSIDEAIGYLRRKARAAPEAETIYYLYVLDAEQRLLGVVSFRELFTAPPGATVAEVMHRDLVSVPEDMDQEAVAELFALHDLMAVPVVDPAGRLQGIVTVDDIVDVVQEEATEDIHKLGGMQALDLPYLETRFWQMIGKRAGWLSVLFVGELLTANAMGHFEAEIGRAVVLALFVPLIISSGGNSGSQATMLVIRAMALGEVRLKDWWRVIRREVAVGFALGLILAAIGLARIVAGEAFLGSYGEHYLLLGVTVAVSLAGVVLWGTIAGSMLPFVISFFGLDPASASAPFVATLVDVSGLVIYFTVASAVLQGTLL